MELFVLSALLIIGLVLLLVELLFIPGTTVVGVLGFLVSGGRTCFCISEF